MNGISSLMDIEIENPVNCLHLVMKEIKISQKIRNEVEMCIRDRFLTGFLLQATEWWTAGGAWDWDCLYAGLLLWHMGER